jgi:CRP-like cAMP-binding protein
MEYPKHQKLIGLLADMVEIDHSDKEIIVQSFEPVSYAKRTILVDERRTARYMYFINSGYLRTYYFKDGVEVTNQINCPLGFMTAFGSYISGDPSYETLECITDCELLRIKKEKLDMLFQHNPKWAEAGRIINEQIVIYNAQRTQDLVSKTAEERYLLLMKNYPDYIQHVPLQYIASFIGVKPESLSRIRKSVAGQTHMV